MQTNKNKTTQIQTSTTQTQANKDKLTQIQTNRNK